MTNDETKTKILGIPSSALSIAQDLAMIEEIKYMQSTPNAKHKDSSDAKALTAFYSTPKNIHVSIPFKTDPLPSKPITEILSTKAAEILNKPLIEFGSRNGYPVIFVVETITSQTPKDFFHEFTTESNIKLTCFKSHEMHEAAKYAQKVLGTLGIFDPRKDSNFKMEEQCNT